MKLDGAVEPRHGAPCIHGSSSANNVVKVFEQRKGNKQCETSTPSMHKQTQQQPQCADEKKANATTAAAASAAASAALSSKFVSNNSNSDTNNNNKQSVCHIKCNTNNNNNNDDSDTKNNAKVESIKRAVKQAKQRATEIKQNKRQKTIDVVDFKSLTVNATFPIAADADAAASANVNAAFIKRNQKMRVQQSLMAARKRHVANIDGGNGSGFDTLRHVQCVSLSRAVGGINMSLYKIVLCLVSIVVVVLPHHVLCDDGDNFFGVNSFSMGPETTTPEFDYASRGQKKFGDKCDNTLECGFPGSICDPKKKSCQCTEDLPVTNHFDKCGKEAAINESCFFNEQCEVKYFQTECRDGRCICRFEMMPFWGKDGSVECKAGREKKNGNETYIDPAMIGVLVGMALMFIIICVVLRLFSQARWHDNRTIFNTPNPRLMNVSLLRDSKLLHGQERRGSRMSVRAPSRQPSMASLRPHSPNPSLGSQTGSHGSNASATSVRSTRSNSVAPGKLSNHERKASSHHHHHQPQQQQHSQNQEPLITNITANPVAESVTVEIIESGK